MRKRHTISICLIIFTFAISLTFLTSCLSLVPENGSKTTSVKEITELSDILSASPELVYEDKSLSELAEEFNTESAVTDNVENTSESIDDSTSVYNESPNNTDSANSTLLLPSEENSSVNADFFNSSNSSDSSNYSEPVIITGTSILENNDNNDFTSASDSWMSASDMSNQYQKIDPAIFVSAEDLPLEVAGKDITNTSTVTPDNLNIIWEDEVYTPDVVVSSAPADISNERDILKEYEQFVADLGDDYTVAKSDDISLEELLAVSEKNSSDGQKTENNLYDEKENDSTWEEVPTETAESNTKTEGEKAGIGAFFKGVWNDIKALAVNLGSTVKGWFVKKK